MPLKQRNVVIDLGEVAAGNASGEVDLSSMTHLVLYIEPTETVSAPSVYFAEFCPLPIGETAAESDWYEVWGMTANPVAPNTLAKIPIPYMYGVGQTFNQVVPLPTSKFLTGSAVFNSFEMGLGVAGRRMRFVVPMDDPIFGTGYDANLKVEGIRQIG